MKKNTYGNIEDLVSKFSLNIIFEKTSELFEEFCFVKIVNVAIITPVGKFQKNYQV